MAARTLLFTTLAAFALAASASSNSSPKIQHLDDIPAKLKTTSVVKTYNGPQIDNSNAYNPSHKTPSRLLRHRRRRSDSSSKLNELDARWTVTTHECLDPLDRPIPEDCDQVCADVLAMEGGIFLEPMQIWTHESGHCNFGVANLDPCEHLSIDPANVIQPLCTSMLTQCIRDGYDGFVETVNPRMALAMSGTAAAPPYSQEPCGNE